MKLYGYPDVRYVVVASVVMASVTYGQVRRTANGSTAARTSAIPSTSSGRELDCQTCAPYDDPIAGGHSTTASKTSPTALRTFPTNTTSPAKLTLRHLIM